MKEFVGIPQRGCRLLANSKTVHRASGLGAELVTECMRSFEVEK